MKAKTSQAKPPRRILVIDVGGSHVKFRIGPRGKIYRFDSGPTLTAQHMVQGVTEVLPASSYDAVSIGYPGLVFQGRIAADPHNLGGGWVHFDFQKAFGKPVRLINDATMQAIGSYEGGRMLFLGLGTGLGSAMIVDGTIEPMELAHLSYKKGTYEDYVGARSLAKRGKKKWRSLVAEVVNCLIAALEPDDVVLGGGNVKKLKELPKGCREGDNANAFLGGFRLWEKADKRRTSSPAKTRASLAQRDKGSQR